MSPTSSVDKGDGQPPMWAILSELKALMAGLQATSNSIKDEQAAIRQRIHDLANQLTPLMGIPDQVREMKAQHGDLKTQIQALTAKVDTLVPVADRVARMEPTVDKLNDDANRGRGALMMASIFGGIIGAILTLLVNLGLLHKP